MNSTPAELETWMQDAATALGVTDADIPIEALLNATRDVAHNVMRPAAPLTTYLLGLAVARGASAEDAIETVRALITDRD